jgi:hypothetical protein
MNIDQIVQPASGKWWILIKLYSLHLVSHMWKFWFCQIQKIATTQSHGQKQHLQIKSHYLQLTSTQVTVKRDPYMIKFWFWQIEKIATTQSHGQKQHLQIKSHYLQLTSTQVAVKRDPYMWKFWFCKIQK